MKPRMWSGQLAVEFDQADASRDSYRAALVVLNVKLICEFAPFVRDQSEYENFRHRAIDLAMSIQDEAHRNYALKLVEELSNAKRRQWEEDAQDTAKGQRTAQVAGPSITGPEPQHPVDCQMTLWSPGPIRALRAEVRLYRLADAPCEGVGPPLGVKSRLEAGQRRCRLCAMSRHPTLTSSSSGAQSPAATAARSLSDKVKARRAN